MKNIRQISKKIRDNDKLRTTLVKKGLREEFIKTYSTKYDIENYNTANHWDNIFENSGKLSDQSPMTKDKIGIIAKEIPSKKLSILDLGIGNGFVEEILNHRKIKYELSAIDISKISISKMNRTYKGNFKLGDVLNVQKYFKVQSFDIILAIELLEHISVSKLFSLYQQIHSLLKNKGRFVFSIPINENLHLMDINPSAHVRDYTYEIIRLELFMNGFEIEKITYLFAFNKYYSLKKSLSRVLKARWKPNSMIIVARKVSAKKGKKSI